MVNDYTPRNSKIQKSSSKIAFSSSRLTWNKSNIFKLSRLQKILNQNWSIGYRISILNWNRTSHFGRNIYKINSIYSLNPSYNKNVCQAQMLFAVSLNNIFDLSVTEVHCRKLWRFLKVLMSRCRVILISMIRNRMTFPQRYQNEFHIKSYF